MSVAAEYEMLLTNRLILTWETEANAFGKSDPEQVIGSGLSTVELGLRLRYEITRQFAPYTRTNTITPPAACSMVDVLSPSKSVLEKVGCAAISAR